MKKFVHKPIFHPDVLTLNCYDQIVEQIFLKENKHEVISVILRDERISLLEQCCCQVKFKIHNLICFEERKNEYELIIISKSNMKIKSSFLNSEVVEITICNKVARAGGPLCNPT